MADLTREEWVEAVKKEDMAESIRRRETLPGAYVSCPLCGKEVGVQVPTGYAVYNTSTHDVSEKTGTNMEEFIVRLDASYLALLVADGAIGTDRHASYEATFDAARRDVIRLAGYGEETDDELRDPAGSSHRED